ncbi:MAG: hypothetical protein RBT63_06460, partial [Bdellovibrionales bacterium]|nr:hypothetical protein [Bdellovibrionales bacterium]
MAIGLSNVNRRKPQSAAQKPQAKATSQLSLVAAVPAVVRPFIQPLKRERLTSSGEINEVWLEWASMVPGLIGKAPR